MRLKDYFLPTLREVPAEAEVISHILMLRAAMIRKLASGIYSYLPYGYAALENVRSIVREEMNRAGAIELFLPGVQPAELWQESGRWEHYGKELLRLKDRHDHEFCLGPTHEEVITDLVRKEVRSYRDLPVNLYQFQQKFRDEIRPRFGVMRGREFCMKDAYSFDADEAGAAESYRIMRDAYVRIFNRLGLKFKMVEADTGAIGGSSSHEFMVLADTGEDAVVSCQECDYAANVERAEVKATADSNQPGSAQARPMERVSTPNVRTIEELAPFLDVGPERLVKTILFMTEKGPVAAMVRGDHEVNEVKVKRATSAETIEMAGPEAVKRLSRAPVGFAGPVGLEEGVTLLADQSLAGMSDWITGANEADAHLLNVNPGRDFAKPAFADIRNISEQDPCPRCGGRIEFLRGIEVGHIFQLGTKYSKAMGANYLDAEGKQAPVVMGCYGLGVDRTLAAAIEQNHDDNGIIFPTPMAPFKAVVVPAGKDEAVGAAAEDIYGELCALGVDSLLDDRDMRPGAKFKDADLIGAPFRVTVGRALKDGQVEFKARRDKDASLLPKDEAAKKTAALIAESLRD